MVRRLISALFLLAAGTVLAQVQNEWMVAAGMAIVLGTPFGWLLFDVEDR